MMRQCLQELEKNPQVTATELVYKYNITSELVARHLNLPQLLMMLSGEKDLGFCLRLRNLDWIYMVQRIGKIHIISTRILICHILIKKCIQ